MASVRAEETESHLEALADEGEAGRFGRGDHQFLGAGAARVRKSLVLRTGAVGRAAVGRLRSGRAQLRRAVAASPMQVFMRQPHSE
jgi:hypothetical protein